MANLPNLEELEDTSQSSSELDDDAELGCQSVEVSATGKNGENRCISPEFFPVGQNGTDNGVEQMCACSKIGKNGTNAKNKQPVDVVEEPKDQSREVSSMDNQGLDIDGKQGHQIPNEADKYVQPELGIEFKSEDHAYQCYNRYAALHGFSIRKDFVNKSKANGLVVSRRYTCNKQGMKKPYDCVVKKPRKDTRTGCLAHMTVARQPNGKYRVTHFKNTHNHEFATQFTADTLPSQKRITFAQAVEAELSNKSVEDGVPKLGMGFDSEENAYEFYNAYAAQVGFSVRKDYVNRSKVDGAVASRRQKGFNVKRPRKEMRIGCLAQLIIARQHDGIYRITHFEEKHNHELVPPCRIHLLRSQKRSTVVQASEAAAMEGSGIQSRTAFGGGASLGNCPVDVRSNLPTKRSRGMKQGEAESIFQYFQKKQSKDPSFFYAVLLDAEGRMANVFWADSNMLTDYGDFDCRAFAPFIGVNHHRQVLIFGASLLYDETVESFQWLFRTFLEAMSGKKPKTILTGQDAAVAGAINLILPEVHHRLCVWHVYQNMLKHISQSTGDLDSFSSTLRNCIFDHEEEQDFIDSWKAMLDAYGLWENEWLVYMFREREKWAIPYGRHTFCADINSALLSESYNTNFRKYLKSDFDVLRLFKHFGKVVNDWRYKELEANYDMSQHLPRLLGDVIVLRSVRDVYTPKIFELFQQEYETALNAVVNHCTENAPLFDYKVGLYGEVPEHTVVFNSSEHSVVCNCMKFQFIGVLCSHALKVLDYRNIKVVPTRYILKRWTKDARV
ncbi:hypothetical protein NMG60_11006765 [Bertholletia excelsa]